MSERSSNAPNGHFAELQHGVPKQSIKLKLPSRNLHDEELTEPDDSADLSEDPDERHKRVDEARQRHEADLLEHHYETPKVGRVQDE